MSLKRVDRADADLRAYLLGQLPEEQQQRVEARIFADEQAQEEMLAVEEDLIDDYVRGDLSASDRANFESHFLSSERRAQKESLARALAATLDTSSEEFHSVSSYRLRVPWAAAAAAVLVIAAAAWFALRSGPAPIPPPQQPGRVAAPDNRAAIPDAAPRPPDPPAGGSEAAPMKPPQQAV